MHTKDSRTHGLPLPELNHIPHSIGRNWSKIHINRLSTMETNCQSNSKNWGRKKALFATIIFGVRWRRGSKEHCKSWKHQGSSLPAAVCRAGRQLKGTALCQTQWGFLSQTRHTIHGPGVSTATMSNHFIDVSLYLHTELGDSPGALLGVLTSRF